MSKFLRLRSIALPAVLAIAGAGLVGCGDDGTPGVECEGQLGAKVEAFSDSVDVLIKASTDMKAELGIACYGIAKDLGDNTVQDPGNGQNLEDEQLRTRCSAASTRLDAAVSAAGRLTITTEGGQGRVNAEAQVNCEASCSANAECSAGEASARCEPGELSVVCQGECAASATCQGSANVAANCEGSCDATCAGECDGTCAGDTDTSEAGFKGVCNGKCEGTCNGNCKLAADANIECGAQARCKGECTGTATAPRCEVKLDPPECEIDADCSAACESRASLQAECEPLKVVVSFSGTANASLKTTLEKNMPAVLRIAGKLELAGQAIGGVGSAAAGVATEALASTQCAAAVGTGFGTKMAAALEASVSINVSVQASADVSGSASGSSG